MNYYFFLDFPDKNFSSSLDIFNMPSNLKLCNDKIKDCLDQDRAKTLAKIEKCSYLFSLKQNPKIKYNHRNSEDFIWISLYK